MRVLAFGLFTVLGLPGQTITTVAGSGTSGFSGDNGAATQAKIDISYGMAVNAQGDMFIADSWNHRVRKITGTTITTVAGTGESGFDGDGGAAVSAKLSFPRAVAVDAQGNLYIADTGNCRIRKVASNGIISTFAGNGNAGYSGDGGSATSAQLNYPRGLAVDTAGNVYVADTWNYRIRKINTAGTIQATIQTIAGNGSYGPYGDGGPATAASLGVVHDLALDAQSNLYFTDAYLHRVRKIGTDGIITTVVGGGFGPGSDVASASTATLKFPKGIAVTPQGEVILADSLNHRVRKVSGANLVSVAGTGIPGYSGDGGPATSAQLKAPYDLTTDSQGNLILSDIWNYRVRTTAASAQTCGCDLNGDGAVNVADVQLIINQALGLAAAKCDINGDGTVNVADVQKVINAALGLGCK